MFDGIPEKDNYDSTGDASVVVNIVPTDVATKSAPEELPEPVTGVTRMTTTSSIDGCMNDSSDSSLARGLSITLYSVIRDFDSKAEDTFRSQDQLSFAIDRLTRGAPLPCIMQHAAKISGFRKRVSSLNSLLKSIQRRVDNVDQMLYEGLLHERMTTRNAGEQ